ncbi:MAG: hypothetical protein JW795_23705 [Chitinivibrionales bacterium]|nr:hypothetical protein [Chitinivibrionales bacterium]
MKWTPLLPAYFIARTVDGGNWLNELKQPHSRSPSIGKSSICFPDKQNGWITDGRDGVLHTTDAGETWVRIMDSTMASGLYSVSFSDPYNGWLCGKNGLILKTTDGGQKWIPCDLKNSPMIRSVVYQSKNTLWAIGTTVQVQTEKDVLAISRDGGRQWTVAVSGESYSFFAINR